MYKLRPSPLLRLHSNRLAILASKHDLACLIQPQFYPFLINRWAVGSDTHAIALRLIRGTAAKEFSQVPEYQCLGYPFLHPFANRPLPPCPFPLPKGSSHQNLIAVSSPNLEKYIVILHPYTTTFPFISQQCVGVSRVMCCCCSLLQRGPRWRVAEERRINDRRWWCLERLQ